MPTPCPDTLAAVLTRELDWSALPASTPAALRDLLRRCLERKPKNRLHDIADARLVIDDLLAGRIAAESRARCQCRLASRAAAAGLGDWPGSRRSGARCARDRRARPHPLAGGVASSPGGALADLLGDERRREHLRRRAVRRVRFGPRRRAAHLVETAGHRRGGGADRRAGSRAAHLARLELGPVHAGDRIRIRPLPDPARRRRAAPPGSQRPSFHRGLVAGRAPDRLRARARSSTVAVLADSGGGRRGEAPRRAGGGGSRYHRVAGRPAARGG